MAVNRREFLEWGLASSVLPGISMRDSESQASAVDKGVGWMDEQPLVISMNAFTPLYARRRATFPQWQAQDYHFGFSETAAREMKALGVSVAIATSFQGYGLDIERHTIQEFKEGAAAWRKYGIKVGAYIGGTLHYETFVLEVPEAQEWLVSAYLGKPVIYDHQWDRRWPYFMHPGYREYIKRVIRVVTEELRPDLFLFDHTSMQAEPEMFQHPLAIEDFRSFLLTHGKSADLKRWLGTADVRYVIPPKVDWVLTTIDDRLFQEWMDFRCLMLAQYYKEMAALIHSLNPNAGIVTNPHRGLSGINTMWYEGVDYPRLLPYMQAAWSEEGNYPTVRGDGILVSEIRTFKMASILGARTVTYTGVPYVGTVPDERHMQLEMAQSMAYSRQCLGDIGPSFSFAKLSEGTRNYIKFFHQHFDLYRDVESSADVALLHSYASLAMNNDRPYQSTYLFEQVLIQSRVPFDIIFDEHLKALSKYRVLIVADQECLSEDECDSIRQFVESGGGLVATEFTSLFTLRHRRRRNYMLADLFKVPAPPYVMWVEDKPLSIPPARNRVGRGRVVYVSEVKPAIPKPPGVAMTSQYWKLPVNTDELIEAVAWAADDNLMLEVKAPKTVTANLLRQRGSGALQIHLVNYNVGENTSVENIEVSMRLPSGVSGRQVRVFSPDTSDVVPIEGAYRNGKLEFGLPSLEVYSVVEIR